jgi:hypothetical protein
MQFTLVYWRHFGRIEQVFGTLEEALSHAWYLHDSEEGYPEQVIGEDGAVLMDHEKLFAYYIARYDKEKE